MFRSLGVVSLLVLGGLTAQRGAFTPYGKPSGIEKHFALVADPSSPPNIGKPVTLFMSPVTSALYVPRFFVVAGVRRTDRPVATMRMLVEPVLIVPTQPLVSRVWSQWVGNRSITYFHFYSKWQFTLPSVPALVGQKFYFQAHASLQHAGHNWASNGLEMAVGKK